jgi:TP901 family phage tail tape measure protein
MQSVGAGMSRVGRGLTTYVSLPLAAAGAASIKLATDFEHSFSQIRSLVGDVGMPLGQMKRQVLDLSGQTAKSPKELADALYFVVSSGFKGAQALDVLRASAKASAAGLGDTATVADAVTSAVNAYGQSNLKAERATDILLATVREGKAEPTELAGAIGRVIAPAEAMGVAFDDVGAALAGLSLTGLDAHEAVTGLRGILTSIMNPTEEAKDALKGYGITTEELQRNLSRDFIGTLMDLRKELGNNKVATGEVFGNVRAMNAFLALTGRNAEKNVGIFKELAGATGDTGRAFDKAQRDPMFKFNQALADLQRAGIELGTELLPIVTDLAKELSKLAKWFSDLPDGVQSSIAKFLVLGTVLGPIVRMLGGIVSLGGKAVGGLAKIAGARGAAAAGQAAGGAAAAGAGGITFAGAATTGAILAVAAAAVAAKIQVDKQNKTNETARESIIKLGLGHKDAKEHIDKLAIAYDELTPGIDLQVGTVGDLRRAHAAYVRELTQTTGATKDYDAVTHRASNLTERQRKRIGTLIGAHKDLAGGLDASTRRQVDNLMAMGDTSGALKLLRTRLDEALAKLNGFAGGNKKSQGAMRDTEEAADNLVQRGIKPLGAAVRLTPSHKRINISAPGLNETYGTFRNLKAFLEGIPRSINIHTTFTQTGIGPRGFKPLPNRQRGGSVRAGLSYIVGEREPEVLTMGAQSGHVTPMHRFRPAHEGGIGIGEADFEEAIVRAMRRVGNVGPMEVRDNLFLGIDDFERRTDETRRRRQLLLGGRG